MDLTPFFGTAEQWPQWVSCSGYGTFCRPQPVDWVACEIHDASVPQRCIVTRDSRRQSLTLCASAAA